MMSRSDKPTDRIFPDDAPNLSEPYWVERFAKAVVRRGRPPSDTPDADVPVDETAGQTA